MVNDQKSCKLGEFRKCEIVHFHSTWENLYSVKSDILKKISKFGKMLKFPNTGNMTYSQGDFYLALFLRYKETYNSQESATTVQLWMIESV